MRLKTLMMMIVALGLALGSYGCAGEEVARQAALQLRLSVVEDEKLIDKNIETQTTFFQKQQETIENSRTRNITYQLDGERDHRAAEAATVMSLNPDQEARLSNLMNYLIDTNDKEYELWKKLYGQDQQAREDLQSKIAKLQRQKKVLTQVKDNLNQLALAPNKKKRARMLLQFSQQTFSALKASR